MRKKLSSIRYNDNKVGFVKDKEGLVSLQRVFNFLLDRYCLENNFEEKVVEKTIKEKIEKPKKETPKTEIPFDSYIIEIKTATSLESLQLTINEFLNDSKLAEMEKINLRMFAKAKEDEFNI